MSIETESIGAPHVRSLTRWGVPFHYGLPVAVALVGLLMLAGGDLVAVLGAWWLAVALPIAIGGFLRDPSFAFAPLAVWVLWLVIAAVAGADSGVAHTPVAVALALALVGGIATRVAQYAIFPATAHEAWAPTVHRLAHPGDHGPGAEGVGEATEPLDLADRPAFASLTAGEDAAQMTVAMGALTALEPLGTAERAALADPPAEPVGTAERAALADSPAADPIAEAADAVAAAVAAAVDSTPDTADAPVATAEEKPTPAAAPPAPAAAPTPPKVVHHELPMGADPAGLDEGGHVSEFTAITDADLAAAAASDADQPGSRDVG
ncbi:MAG: hypothetical protein AAGC46_03770 [Solirubrobacteraceae bacterium]|nr:hypothetical protein [Patulibacter sp.]